MAEVKRIEAYDKKTRAEREELINLLESPRSMADTRGYEGSQGMNILHQTLVAADKTKAKQQQRKASISQVNVVPGTAAQDAAMNARDEVTRRFKKFSPKEGLTFLRYLAHLRIYLWHCVPGKDCTRCVIQVNETRYFQACCCPESVQCIQRNRTFGESGYADLTSLRKDGEIARSHTTYA